MRTVLPGKPPAKLQAVSTARWEGKRLVVYISGNGFAILGDPQDLIQTIYLDHCEALIAVVIDEQSGKIATCSSDEIYVYKPYGKDEGILKWSLNLTIPLLEPQKEITTLSWGSDEELLAGSTSLTLYQTVGTGRPIWTRKLPRTVKIAVFSPTASLIASTGWHDRLIKLWRRQSFDLDDTRFDFTYLPHSMSVLDIYWRKAPQHKHHQHEQNVDDVLYSTCADSKIRIWAATDPHEVSHMQLWAQIDMQECLQPRELDTALCYSDRFVFFIDSDQFSKVTSQALNSETKVSEGEAHKLEHLAEVAKTKPDVCVVLDRHGNMSAWGLESVGCKVRKESDIFNIAHVQDFNLPYKQSLEWQEDDNVLFLCFVHHPLSSAISLVTHYFDGRISWHDANVDALFDPSPRHDRICSKALWTGHESPVTMLVRDTSGRALLSRSDDNEILVWRRNSEVGESLLPRQSTLLCSSHIRCCCVLEEGRFVVIIQAETISLWDTRDSTADLISSCSLGTHDTFLCLLLVPNSTNCPNRQYIAAVTSSMSGFVWAFGLPATKEGHVMNGHDSFPGLTEFCTFRTDVEDEMTFVLPVDPAGSSYPSTGFLDRFAKEQAVSYSGAGLVYTWAANVDSERTRADWYLVSTVRTGVTNPSLASGSSTRKIGLVNATRLGLTIWDTRTSLMEYDKNFDALDTIQDLDWSNTPDSQSLLAVGFPHKVTIMAQMRYDYSSQGTAWAPIRVVSTKELTSHPIGDSVWLNEGNLVIGAGNQLYICSEVISMADDMINDLEVAVHGESSGSMLNLVSYLNGPLPVYNPQFLSQCVLAGRTNLTYHIVLALNNILKYFTPGGELDGYLELTLEEFYADIPVKEIAAIKVKNDDRDEPEELTEDVAMSINDRLSNVAIPHLTSADQLHLAEGIECLSLIAKQKRAMDENAMRYYFFLNQHMLRGRRAKDEANFSWREINWALHSNSQDILVDHVSRQFRGKIRWENARESGMFMWLTDPSALQAQFEVIARNEYTKTEEKNPIDCSLYYLALRKKSVLLGLWRMATWNREQAGTQRLLKNNFSEARWKTAASKNAYALLGKRRFEYAAAWFLLGGKLQDAVNVCVHQMEDLQLAIAVARVYDGDDSQVLRSLLNDKVLPQAAHNGNRWQATWAFWMLGQHRMAINALIEPLHELISLPHSPKKEARSYLAHDPALIVLYKHLREKSPQTRNDVSLISPRAEWDFVIQTARTYDRMGCDLLALDLVRNWRFVSPPKETPPIVEVKKERRKSGRRRSSAAVPTMPKSPTKEKPKPTMFKEPEASSLLDSFGF